MLEDHAGRTLTLNDVAAFPDGLRCFYDDLFARTLADGGTDTDIAATLTLLAVLLAAQVPVTLEFLAAVLHVSVAGMA